MWAARAVLALLRKEFLSLMAASAISFIWHCKGTKISVVLQINRQKRHAKKHVMKKWANKGIRRIQFSVFSFYFATPSSIVTLIINYIIYILYNFINIYILISFLSGALFSAPHTPIHFKNWKLKSESKNPLNVILQNTHTSPVP